jgi:xanthine/uracil permease
MSSTPVSNINFSLEYAVSIIVIIIVCNLLLKKSPQMNVFIVVVIGLIVGYIILFFMNNIFPHINNTANNVYQYYMYQIISRYTSMGYMHIFPPILAILIIFIILLYRRDLG